MKGLSLQVAKYFLQVLASRSKTRPLHEVIDSVENGKVVGHEFGILFRENRTEAYVEMHSEELGKRRLN